MPENRALLFVNGQAPQASLLEIFPDDFLIAVDGGLRYLTERGLLPDILIGDLDSVRMEDLHRCEESGVEILRFPFKKDETDLELAILEAQKRACTQIVIAYGLGGRVDHTLGNLSLLGNPHLSNLEMRFDDGETEVFFLSGANARRSFQTKKGDIISLIPCQGDVQGVTTTGLAYPLHDETLFAWKPRGVSNEALEEVASVAIETGKLLVFHIRK